MNDSKDDSNSIASEELEEFKKKILKEQGDTQQGERQEEIDDKPLSKVTKDDIEFVINTMTKEAKYDLLSIKQLFFGMSSAFTKIPMSHNVNSKDSGAGKSYLLNLVGDYFPDKHLMILAGASAKALHHREGIMVIKDENTGELKPVEPIFEKLEEELDALGHKKENKSRIREINLKLGI